MKFKIGDDISFHPFGDDYITVGTIQYQTSNPMIFRVLMYGAR